MSRYVDADALRKELEESIEQAKKRLDGVAESNIACRLVYTTQFHERDTLLSLVNWMPTADVVEVVRCRDCKHFGRQISAEYHTCNKYALPFCGEDFFCSYGERRAEE